MSSFQAVVVVVEVVKNRVKFFDNEIIFIVKQEFNLYLKLSLIIPKNRKIYKYYF